DFAGAWRVSGRDCLYLLEPPGQANALSPASLASGGYVARRRCGSLPDIVFSCVPARRIPDLCGLPPIVAPALLFDCRTRSSWPGDSSDYCFGGAGPERGARMISLRNLTYTYPQA